MDNQALKESFARVKNDIMNIQAQLMEIMHRFIAEHPDVRLSCLPHMDGDYRETELGVRAPPQAARLAHSWLRDALSEAGFTFKEGGR